MQLNVIPFKSRKESKIEFLRERYVNEEKAKDAADTGVNIPYFLRADNRIKEIQRAGMVESEYKKYKKEV